MFLDYDIYFDRPDRVYSPGDTVTCKIDVKSMFNINCKYVRARFRCPFKSKEIEYFRIYEIASKRIATRKKYRIGEKGLSVGLRVMLLQKLLTSIVGLSYFVVLFYSSLFKSCL